MTSRNFQNVAATINPEVMASSYNSMLKKVVNMIQKEGPIYSTWIRFQIGKGSDNIIIFDSTSNNSLQNLISELSFDKKGAGVVNSFELNVKYDPFNYGQNAGDQIEKLDELVAYAMSYNMTNDLDRLRGYIQYGYNNPNDATMVSPKYEFLLTNASSSIDWASGIASYTFEGTTDLAADSNYKVAVPEFKNVNILEAVYTVLYCSYGDPNDDPGDHLLSRYGANTK